MILRDYQTDIVNATRQAFADGNNSVCVQLATGGGKTPVQTSILSSLNKNNKIAWHISPRHEIQNQVSEHFKKWNTPHNFIDSNHKESKAFNIHIVSKDTLTRRWDKIKTIPDYAIIDECHLNYEFQLSFRERYPDCKIIGMSATPERLDGKGLSAIYNKLVEGPSIPDLTSRGFLTPLKYFSPPIQGLENIHRKGTEYDADELEMLLQKRRIYGEAIEHYKKYADKKPALVFCRSVKSAEETAHRFSAAGYKFENLDSANFSMQQRKTVLDALRDGKIDGICSVDLFLYGLDIPRIEVGICLRPTLSRALYMQMIGRILRPYELYEMVKNENGIWVYSNRLKYKKKSAMFFDHVGNLFEHQDPKYPGTPLHYLNHISWNFDGTTKRPKNTTDERLTSLRLCPNCYLYFEGITCPNCGTSCQKQREELKKVEAELVEIIPVPLADRPHEEKKEYIDRIEKAVAECSLQILPGAVGEMLAMSKELGYPPMWVYHKLNQNKVAVNVPLLAEISRQEGYKKGWAWIQREKLKGRR